MLLKQAGAELRKSLPQSSRAVPLLLGRRLVVRLEDAAERHEVLSPRVAEDAVKPGRAALHGAFRCLSVRGPARERGLVPVDHVLDQGPAVPDIILSLHVQQYGVLRHRNEGAAFSLLIEQGELSCLLRNVARCDVKGIVAASLRLEESQVRVQALRYLLTSLLAHVDNFAFFLHGGIIEVPLQYRGSLSVPPPPLWSLVGSSERVEGMDA
mmetsp:Transcript_1205/g.2268  ORF Transcript_1205/g.2268 Transcript_1205/m.2268 type:complete len:211 (+) Transcript_1205:234-866(+)